MRHEEYIREVEICLARLKEINDRYEREKRHEDIRSEQVRQQLRRRRRWPKQ